MRDKRETLHGRNAGLRDQGKRTIRAEQSQPHYTHIAELIQDCQQFEREVKHFRSVTPEKRTCVYGITESVPNTAAALRRTGRYY